MSLANRWNLMPTKLTVLLVDDHALRPPRFSPLLEDDLRSTSRRSQSTGGGPRWPCNSPRQLPPPFIVMDLRPFRQSKRHRSRPPHPRQFLIFGDPHAQHAFQDTLIRQSLSRRRGYNPEKRDGSRPRPLPSRKCPKDKRFSIRKSPSTGNLMGERDNRLTRANSSPSASPLSP